VAAPEHPQPERSGQDLAGPADLVDRHTARALELLPELDPEVEAAVARITKLARYLDRTLAETLAGFDLSLGEYKLLVQLRIAAPRFRLTPSELSDTLLVSSGAMTNRLDKLEAAGYVARRPDPRDRRGVHVLLTAAGRRRIEEAIRIQADKEVRLLETLAPDEKSALNALLRKLMIGFEAALGPPPRRVRAEAE
jgi:DNA-binding MarR family transcriptional regulator